MTRPARSSRPPRAARPPQRRAASPLWLLPSGGGGEQAVRSAWKKPVKKAAHATQPSSAMGSSASSRCGGSERLPMGLSRGPGSDSWAEHWYLGTGNYYCVHDHYVSRCILWIHSELRPAVAANKQTLTLRSTTSASASATTHAGPHRCGALQRSATLLCSAVATKCRDLQRRHSMLHTPLQRCAALQRGALCCCAVLPQAGGGAY